MDLVERKREAGQHRSQCLFRQRRAGSSDLDALAALPLFMSLRAAIRAKVTAAKLASTRRRRREAIAAQAQAYFALALRSDRAAAAASGRGRRIVRHRQVGAGARACAAHRALTRARWCCARMSSARRCSALRETEKLPPQAYTAEVAAARLCHARGQGAARRCGRPFSDRRRGVCARRPSAPALPNLRARRPVCDFRGLFLTADLATRIARVGDARSRRIRCRRGGRAAAGALRNSASSTGHEIDASGTPEETLAQAKEALQVSGRRHGSPNR